MSSEYTSRAVYQTQSAHQYRSSGQAGYMVSGLSSAGTICTVAIRDAREREKREIGILNDRLADYIEKVRFLRAQNHCLEHDIAILKGGFSSGSQISNFFESESSQYKRRVDQLLVNRTAYQKDVTNLAAQIDDYRHKWQEALKVVRAHRADHDVDLDKLAKIEAEASIYIRKIKVVADDVHRIRRENEGILIEIDRVRGQVHTENAMRSERSRHIQDLIARVQYAQTENASRIEQEQVFIRRDTTAENRDYFRRELQAAIRDIRADYEAISRRNREEIEVWYASQVSKIRQFTNVDVDIHQFKEEFNSIRSIVHQITARLSEIESRNALLSSQIEGYRQQQIDDARIYELSLSEKDAVIAKLKERCTEITIQMEKLCDHEVSLQAELERYRVLLNGANVTTYLSSNSGVRTGAVVTQSTTTRSYETGGVVGGYSSGVHVSGSHGGISVGGHIGGVSVGGAVTGVGSNSTSSHVAHSTYSYSSSMH